MPISDPWNPIESAPDDRPFLAITSYNLMCVMRRQGDGKIVRNVTCRRCNGMGLGSLSHWAELPDKPEAEEIADAE